MMDKKNLEYQKFLDDEKARIKKENRKSRILWTIAVIAFLLFFFWSFYSIFGTYEGMANKWQQNISYIFSGMLNPDTELLFDMNETTGIITTTSHRTKASFTKVYPI